MTRTIDIPPGLLLVRFVLAALLIGVSPAILPAWTDATPAHQHVLSDANPFTTALAERHNPPSHDPLASPQSVTATLPAAERFALRHPPVAQPYNEPGTSPLSLRLTLVQKTSADL